MANSFFSRAGNTWDEYYYADLRNKYSNAIPVPSRNYIKPIESIDDFATLAVRPIEKPLWLTVNALSFLLKAALYAAASIVLAPCALGLLLIAPNSELCEKTCASFKVAAANTLVALGMSAVALLSAAISLIFNPVLLVSRVAATALDHVNSATEACFGVTIARL